MQGLRRRLLTTISNTKVTSGVSPYLSAGRVGYVTERISDVGQPTFSSHPQLLVEGHITPGITIAEYLSRRKRLVELLPEKSIAIIASAPVKMMTDVVPYSFRQDADYLYITGCSQPGGLAVLSEESGLCMFMPEQDFHDVTWHGQVAGVDAALDYFKAENAYPLSMMRKILPEMIGKASCLFHNLKTASPSYMKLEAFQSASSNNKVKDLSNYTDELRWIKSPSELKLMRRSASIACESLLRTMMFSRSSPEENKLAAKFEYECKMRGAQRMAFNPVVGGGANGSVIHYSRNDQNIRDGNLVLMDVGCEFHGYLSDLTRTWPPCGRFSSDQEILYDLILETNKECMKLCRPGTSIQEIHNYSVQMLRRGLTELGILKSEGSQTYYQLNPTSIGHYLGMDIHDSAMISNDRPLQPGVEIPAAAKFREKGLLFVEEMNIVFGDVLATGAEAYTPASGVLPDLGGGTSHGVEDDAIDLERSDESDDMPRDTFPVFNQSYSDFGTPMESPMGTPLWPSTDPQAEEGRPMAIHNFIRKHTRTDNDFLEYELNEDFIPEESTSADPTLEGEDEILLNQTCGQMVALRDSIRDELVNYHSGNA